jgi:cytoskeletal protein RodZ
MIQVGQKLRETRTKQGLSVGDVEKAIKIKSSFILALERGEYHKLPSAYVQGFVSNYIDFLHLPKRETMALFRREYDAKADFRVLPEGLAKQEPYRSRRFRITPRLMLLIFGVLVLCGFLAYQFRFAYLNPKLVIFQPTNEAAVSRNVVVKGETDANVTLTINEEIVSVSTDGTFSKTITVFPGKSTLIIRAVNRMGKETVTERSVSVE